MRHLLFSLFFICTIAIVTTADWAVSQSFRYIDDAGNIIWVDRIDDVPRRYRNQVLQPTAPPPTVKGGKAQRPAAKKTPKKKPTPKKKKKKEKKPQGGGERSPGREPASVKSEGEAEDDGWGIAPLEASPKK